MINKIFILIAGIYGGLSVALGAFGAHALNKFLTDTNRLDTYNKAVLYQMFHAVALLFLGLFAKYCDSKWVEYSGYSFIIGVIFFSGSLYTLCFTQVKTWGAVTPIGGLFFIAGWVFLVLSSFSLKNL